MVRERKFWHERIEQTWNRRPVLRLTGARRNGKTTLARSLPDVEYVDCASAAVRRELENPAAFLAGLRGKRVVIDGMERLVQPERLLESADNYPDIRILATGSLSQAFLPGMCGRQPRGGELWLTPLIMPDLQDFDRADMKQRLRNGGLPDFFLAGAVEERDFQAWLEEYWGNDVRDTFRLASRNGFQTFMEQLMARSGQLFEATRHAGPCGVSRTTIAKYLSVLEATFVVHTLPPFSTRRATEIVAAPRVYAFDTGFVCHHRGWLDLRRDDMTDLWRHFVLNELHARLQSRKIYYWRDKREHEVDFVLMRKWMEPTAICCPWSAADFDPAGLRAFRFQYPRGVSYVVTHDALAGESRAVGDMEVRFVTLAGLIEELSGPAAEPAIR